MQMEETSATVPTVDDMYRRGLYRDLGLCGQAITKLSEQMRDGDESVRDNAVQALATRIGELLDIAQCIDEPRRPHWCDDLSSATGALSVIMSDVVEQSTLLSASIARRHMSTAPALRMLDALDRASRFCRQYMREIRRDREVGDGR